MAIIEFIEWLFEEHPFVFDIIVVVLSVIVANVILDLVLMWWFS